MYVLRLVCHILQYRCSKKPRIPIILIIRFIEKEFLSFVYIFNIMILFNCIFCELLDFVGNYVRVEQC
jgi:hypothetical protein